METLQWHFCPRSNYRKPLLACIQCPRYPCTALTPQHRRLLEESPFTEIGPLSKLNARKEKMYLFKMSSGEIKESYADFDPDRPDFEQLVDVDEILFVSKVYVKQLRLVVKSKEERDIIRKRRTSEEKYLSDE